jgi:4-hydroxy-3-methylbut-2-enyl diphosphate reductase
MTVSIDASAGFCWGVVRTVHIAEEELVAGNPLVSLGDIIHNPKEIERIEALGMRTVGQDDLASLEPGTKVLIRAHGEPPATYRRAHELGLQLVDATCPVVTKLQERIRKYYDDGFQIVIFGKKDHAEVIGLRGVVNDECVVIKSLDEARSLVDVARSTVLFSQTTMDKPTFQAIRDFLETRVKELVVDTMETLASEFHAKDTICGQVSGREQKLRDFARGNDVMLFIAGRKSSNGLVLYEICRDANPRTHFIEDIEEIDAAWFRGAARVGISGATSTPHWLMLRAKESIERIALPERTTNSVSS